MKQNEVLFCILSNALSTVTAFVSLWADFPVSVELHSAFGKRVRGRGRSTFEEF